MSKKCKMICTNFNCIEHLLILSSPVTRFVSVSAFASSVGIPVGIPSPAVAITGGIRKYKSIIKRNKKKHNKIEMLVKVKLSIEILTC